ncbi:hypothetical protein CQW23_07792 [Capsicum baccatum]|uniref:GAGA-binding transcriptional activator n=1 Tax=Capsicum baccatum TaxID=33114 RepID=A0A2G2X786_CAPBA|nr:hypothetical protein CQW23_07792 [Capsicum baccatum]
MQVIATISDDQANLLEMDSDKEADTQLTSWKDNLWLNQINFDESAMPVMVCSCTGTPQPCYKWGHVGGRKMSGGAFSKLLNHFAAQDYDLSIPLDLKDSDQLAKHDTNRYNTLK